MTTKNIQQQINETVDAMMIDFLSALVKVGVPQSKVREAIDLLSQEPKNDNTTKQLLGSNDQWRTFCRGKLIAAFMKGGMKSVLAMVKYALKSSKF